MTGVEVLVETPNGTVHVEFDDGYHVVALLAEAVARLGRTFSGLGAYDLVDEDGNHVGRWATLEAAGVHDGDTLRLDVNPTAI